jgi:hypothetical protein
MEVNDESELSILSDIEKFVNLKQHKKVDWIVDNPDEAVEIVDYLINMTKDR